jgi:glycosyltransferase involved in cell wall biosynthesis
LWHGSQVRIGILPQRYPPDFGGVASASQRYARGLCAAGHSVQVVSLDGRLAPSLWARSEVEGIRQLRVGAERRADDTLSAWFDAVVAEHRAEPFDVLVGRYLDAAAYVAVYAARFLGLPSLVSARGNDVDRGAFDAAVLPRLLWAARHASVVTAVSQELRLKLMALVPELEPLVVHNGVDTELFQPGPADPELGASPLVLFVGEARKKKGLPTLLESYAAVAARFAHARLVLLGGVRSEDAELLEFFARKHADAKVEVVPPCAPEQLVRFYRSAAVFVMPSVRDGLPNALLEAMACGCPIVASAVGGIPDAIRAGVEGLLVAPGDTAALTEALLVSLEDPKAARAYGARARARAVSDFGLARERAADLALLERLVRSG